MKLHDKLLLAINLISEVVLLSICWYQGLIVFLLAVYALISGVPEMICMFMDVYYRIYGQPMQARVVLCTEYEKDGLDQQFLVEYSYEEEDAAKRWIFNPSCLLRDHEHTHRARWPRLVAGDTVDVIVFPSGSCCGFRPTSTSCRMRDTRLDTYLQSICFGLIIILGASMLATMTFLWVGMMLLDRKGICEGICCSLGNKICNVATMMLSVINIRLWCLRKYEGDRTRAL
jgi:hypothetical protein